MTEAGPNLLLWLTVMSLSEQATRDGLTGLYNRRYFDDTLADHIETAKRYKRDLSLAFFDLDNFKQMNDVHGHEAGDAALRQFADALKSTVRQADIVCRYGGDEFAVILPETDHPSAECFAARVSDAIDISFTAGIAALPCDDLVADADADLRVRKKKDKGLHTVKKTESRR